MRGATCKSILVNSAGFGFFGECCLASLNFCPDQHNEISSDYLTALREYLVAITCIGLRGDDDSLFESENFVKPCYRKLVRSLCAALYFRWYSSVDTETRLNSTLRNVTACFNSLGERLRYYRASFDVNDSHQSAALVIFDVRVTDWRAMLGNADGCLENASLRADRAIENALRSALHEAKSSLLTFSNLISEISNDRLSRLRGLFNLECSSELFGGKRDLIVDAHCKQMYVYSFCIAYEVVRKSELILDDYAHNASSLQIMECDEYQCSQTAKVTLEVVRAYNYFSASTPYNGELSQVLHSYSELWREPEAWTQTIDHFIRYIRAITMAATFSTEEYAKFEKDVVDGTGVRNVRISSAIVRQILKQHAHGDILMASTISQMYAHQLRTQPVNDQSSTILDDIVEQDYQTNERIWRYADKDWSTIASEDTYLVTYIYAMLGSNWLSRAEILRSVVRLYARNLFRLLARIVIDYNQSPYDSVENVIPAVEQFMKRRRKTAVDDDDDVVMRERTKRQRASSVDSDEPLAKQFLPYAAEE